MKILISFIVFFSLNVNAKPFIFKNINMEMSPIEQRDIVEELGYKCDGSVVFNCNAKLLDGKAKILDDFILIKNGYAEFSCKSYNGCGHSFLEFAGAVMDKYSITPDYMIFTNPFNGEKTSGYLFSGSMGDRLWILKTKNSSHKVVLLKGSMGEKLDF